MNMDSLRDQIPFSPGDWVADKNNPVWGLGDNP